MVGYGSISSRQEEQISSGNWQNIRAIRCSVVEKWDFNIYQLSIRNWTYIYNWATCQMLNKGIRSFWLYEVRSVDQPRRESPYYSFKQKLLSIPTLTLFSLFLKEILYLMEMEIFFAGKNLFDKKMLRYSHTL